MNGNGMTAGLAALLGGTLAAAAAATGALPAGYTQLAFLESSGTQYIDTGVVFGPTNGFSVTYQTAAPESNQIVCGSRASSGDTRCMVGSNYEYSYVGWGAIRTSFAVPDADMGTVDVNFLNNGKFDCRRISVDSLDALPAQTGSFYLFAGNMAYSGGATIYGKCRIREARISAGKAIVHSFVPARRDADSALGMFDLVNGAFLTNAGTGAFIGGEPVGGDTDAYVRLSWLESVGGQYIDTGVTMTDDHGFAVTYLVTAKEDHQIVCGSRASTGDSRCIVGSNHNNDIPANSFAYVGWNGLMTSFYVPDNAAGEVKVNYLDSHTYDCRGLVADNLGTLAAQTGSFYLFAGNMAYAGGSTIYGKCRIMSFAMTRGRETIMELVPVRRKADGKPGMLDTLNNVFYANQGAGEFVMGAPVLPDGYATLEYVESSGSQYVNTGVKCASDVSVRATLYNPLPASKHMVGARVAYRNGALGLSFQAESGLEGWCAAWGDQVTASLLGASTTEGVGDAFHVFEFGGPFVKIDGMWRIKPSMGAQDFSTDLDIFAFGVNNGGTPHAQAATIRLSGLTIFKNGSPVREYIPVMETNTLAAGFYDIMTGAFHGNAGSGSLIAGEITGGLDAPDALEGAGLGVSEIVADAAAAKSFTADHAGLHRLNVQCKAGAAGTGHSVAVLVDGRNAGTVTPASSIGWTTANIDMSLSSGAHVLTLQGGGAGKSTLVGAATLRRLNQVPEAFTIVVR